MTSSFRRVAIRGLIALLIGLSAVVYAHGFRQTWLLDCDCDMQERLEEYRWFRQGVYPARQLEPDLPRGLRVRYTVYPPYALTMFVPYFEPFGRIQGRIMIQVLSLAGLAAIAVHGFRLLRPAGIDAAVLGAMAAVAIPGNGTALAVGQFSIVCVGCVLLQMVFLDRGRPLAAGTCWALAMLKPQIGLPFGLLFLVRREWRGLALGIAILAGLSLAACWWTDVSPWAVVDYWVFRMNTGFAATTSVSGQIADATGIDSRFIHLGIAVLLLLAPLLVLGATRFSIQADTLTVAAVAGLLGSVLLYHRAYDHLMMFPLLFVALIRAARRPTAWHLGIAAVMASSLWLPQKLVRDLPCEWLLRPALWTACAGALLVGRRRVETAVGSTLPAEPVA